MVLFQKTQYSIIPSFPPEHRPLGPEANWGEALSFVHIEDRF
jgi:hypothetical protein